MIKKNNKLAIAVVGDFNFLRKYLYSFVKQIRNIGKYKGEILIITSLFTPTFLLKLFLRDKNIKIYRFKKIKFSIRTNKALNDINIPGKPNRHKTKKFQWHKFHLFDEKLKNWDQIFYIDINMKIHFDIEPILKLNPENKLFATLDTTVRKVVLDNLPFLLADTVGFIRKLPHDLVESFKSTLDEVREADIIVHVVDISHPNFEYTGKYTSR